MWGIGMILLVTTSCSDRRVVIHFAAIGKEELPIGALACIRT